VLLCHGLIEPSCPKPLVTPSLCITYSCRSLVPALIPLPQFLEHFFTDPDAAFFASLGLNCIRLPVNYRHFEDDMNPRVFKTEGLKHLDRVIEICARYGIYTVIDLHAAPGGECGSGLGWGMVMMRANQERRGGEERQEHVREEKREQGVGSRERG
jgi:hypothetical protein